MVEASKAEQSEKGLATARAKLLDKTCRQRSASTADVIGPSWLFCLHPRRPDPRGV